MRFRAAYPHLSSGSRVCDLGCGLEMAFLDFADDKIAYGVGLDDQVESGTNGRWQRIHADLRGRLPSNLRSCCHVGLDGGDALMSMTNLTTIYWLGPSESLGGV